MAGLCEGRVVIVTGAGNGIGREHALRFAREGAKVVVNDLGGSRSGDGADAGAAAIVAEEIRAAGGEATANTDSVADFDAAERMVGQALETYGRLDVVVNNAGILRDKMLVNMSEAEWDAVIGVHLKGTYAMSHHAARHWRALSKAGEAVDARIINTSSASGIFGNIGQANYGAAKAGIAAMTIIAAMELSRYGVTVNAIAPTALTRMTDDLPHIHELAKQRGNLDAKSISPLVVWLGSEASAAVTGRVFGVYGGRITVHEGWVAGPHIETERMWEPGDLTELIPDLVASAAANAGMNGSREPDDGRIR